MNDLAFKIMTMKKEKGAKKALQKQGTPESEHVDQMSLYKIARGIFPFVQILGTLDCY